MSLLRLALANLKLNPVTSAVNIALLALGTATIVLLLLFSAQLRDTLARDARGIDLVIGAKGSPVQLVLSSIYQADVPTGNIAKFEADRWASDARVALAVPLALGDSVSGFRIVGTTPDYLALYGGQLAQGALWAAPLQAVLGARVARETGLGLHAPLIGAHGLTGGAEHGHDPYRVVGVLAETGTVLDRLVLTSLESVWTLHGEAQGEHEEHTNEHADEAAPSGSSHQQGAHPDEKRHEQGAHADEHHQDQARHDEADHVPQTAAAESPAHAEPARPPGITALLIRYASPLAATTLPMQINRESKLQAASPAMELVRLLQLLGVGLDAVRAFAGVLILSAALSVFAALYGALKARRHDLAMLRCLGATRGALLISLLLEGFVLASLGALLGLALGHAAAEGLGQWLASTRGASFGGAVFLIEELWLLLGLLLVGLAAAALPAWQAYRADVAATLSQP